MLKQLAKWYRTRQAYVELRHLAEMIDSAMQYNLGTREMFINSQGIPKDYAEGARWVRKAAEKKGVGLAFIAGMISSSGEIIKGLRKAAEEGSADAQVILGEICMGEAHAFRIIEPSPMGKDPGMKALIWFGVAALQGDAEAQYNLGLMYHGWSDVVPKNEVEAAQWYRKAAEQGDAKAQEALGWAYEYGLGVLQDHAQAVMWYRKAAENSRSLRDLGKKDLERLRQHSCRGQSSQGR